MPTVLVLALGGAAPADEDLVPRRWPRQLVQRQGPRNARVEWLDRNDLSKMPVATLLHLVHHRYDECVLLTSDLRQPRLKMTGLLAAVPRARRRWIADSQSGLQAFSVFAYLRSNAWTVSRHLAACVASVVLAGPLLRLGLAYLARERRETGAVSVRRLLYLRSQTWFGLQGGGSVAHVAGVIGALVRAGVHVTAVSSDELYGVRAPVQVVRPARWFDGWLKDAEELAYNGPIGIAALRAGRRIRPDAIYQRYEAFNVVGALLSRLLCVPLVLEFNSSDVWKGRHWGGLRLHKIAALGERVNLCAADHVVVVSRVLRDDLVAQGFPAARVHVNPNGVDPAQFRPDIPGYQARQRYGLGKGIVIGFSGTFGVWHGIATLAKTLRPVLDAVPDTRFLLLGSGPLIHLVQQAAANDVPNGRVVLAGMVPHAEMPEHLAACDILLAPHGSQVDGREFFGSPTKLFEYMAMGRAIVASAVGQIADVLEHERTALLVAPDDPTDLAQAIVRLAQDAALRKRLGEAAREQAICSHTWDQNASRIINVLEGGPC